MLQRGHHHRQSLLLASLDCFHLACTSHPFTQIVCYLQVNLSGGKLLRLPIRGYGLAAHLIANPQVMHFGVVPSYEWADQLLELGNSCPELPMHVVFDRSGPYFLAEPAEVDLPPGATASVLVRYLPKVGCSRAPMFRPTD